MARKRHPPLEWHLPPRLSFTFGCLPCDWHFPPLSVTLRWLTEGTHRRNGTFLLHIYSRVPHAPLEWHLPFLHFTLGWLVGVTRVVRKRMQKVCTVRVGHKRFALLDWHLPPLDFTGSVGSWLLAAAQDLYCNQRSIGSWPLAATHPR